MEPTLPTSRHAAVIAIARTAPPKPEARAGTRPADMSRYDEGAHSGCVHALGEGRDERLRATGSLASATHAGERFNRDDFALLAKHTIRKTYPRLLRDGERFRCITGL